MIRIDNLLIQIVVNLPQQIIITSEFLTEAIEKRYNDLMNSEYQNNDLLICQLLAIFEDKLAFQPFNKNYKLF